MQWGGLGRAACLCTDFGLARAAPAISSAGPLSPARNGAARAQRLRASRVRSRIPDRGGCGEAAGGWGRPALERRLLAACGAESAAGRLGRDLA